MLIQSNIHNIKKETHYEPLLKMGRKMGFEPTHIGTTIRGLNHLTTGAINIFIITQTTTKSRTFLQKKSPHKSERIFIFI